MLGKLLKYEFKATAKEFLALYGCLILLAIVNVILLKVSDIFHAEFNLLSILSGIAVFVLVLYLAAIFIITVILCITRFYKNLLGDEGYLMNTLPVSTWANIAGKLIVSVIWSIASIAVILIACLIIGLGLSNVSTLEVFQMVSRAFSVFTREFGGGGYLAVFEMAILGIVSLAGFYLTVYAALTIGHSFAKHKLLLSIAAYAAMSVIETILKSIGILIMDNISYIHLSINRINEIPHGYIWIMTASAAVFAAAYYVITHYFLKHKLNLQ